jgi:TolB-like protein/tetratricopeptide (TPR) repeat protein
MNPGTKRVFLSYASQDAEAARRICEALRAAGVEVWFDQSELRGGDSWDASIRSHIKSCSLFVPLISHSTHAREEGYFRLEWKLAVDRSHLMSAARTFLLPVVVDETPEDDPGIPDRFREVQWTRLRTDDALTAFVERVRRLLADEPAPASAAPPPRKSTKAGEGAHLVGVPNGAPSETPAVVAAPAPGTPRARRSWVVPALTLVILVAVGGFFFLGRSSAPAAVSGGSVAPGAFAPPPHSVAVLPFVNMSGDPKQDYFSDGLSEELLNSLVTVHDLQVAARTSSFFFKGKDVDLAEVARKLNVGAVLEGSVRKDGNQVRITAQLINAVTGFHLWSQTYDRDLKNVLALQSEIATAVTGALQATLMTGAASTMELGGTSDPQAFDAYLRGERLAGRIEKESVLARIAAYDEAIKRDPSFAKAYTGKALGLSDYSGYIASPSEYAKYNAEAGKMARKAVALAPESGRAHAALAQVLAFDFDLRAALAENDRALELANGDAFVLQRSAGLLRFLGNPDKAIANARRAVLLDPLNGLSHQVLGSALLFDRQFPAAIEALERGRSLDPELGLANSFEGMAYSQTGELDKAVNVCSRPPDNLFNHVCLAIVLHYQGHAAAALAEVDKIRQMAGDSAAFQYAEIYAQWGDIAKAMQWLDTAYRLRDGGMVTLKAGIFIAPLRGQPRYKEIERLMNFPD